MFAICATARVGWPILPASMTRFSQRIRFVAITAGAQKSSLPFCFASAINSCASSTDAGQRLLAEDIEPGVEQRGRDFAMERRGGEVDGSVQARVLE